jgi:hypothetical protein
MAPWIPGTMSTRHLSIGRISWPNDYVNGNRNRNLQCNNEQLEEFLKAKKSLEDQYSSIGIHPIPNREIAAPFKRNFCNQPPAFRKEMRRTLKFGAVDPSTLYNHQEGIENFGKVHDA